MTDEIQVGATFHKKRVGKHIAMVEGPCLKATQKNSLNTSKSEVFDIEMN